MIRLYDFDEVRPEEILNRDIRKFNSMDELAALIHHAADESKAYFAALNGAK